MAFITPTPTNTAIITGASSGIGAEFAKVLAARGWHLTLVARRADALEAVARSINPAAGYDIVPTDLADEPARSALIESVQTSTRHPGVLINNAGLSTMGALADSTVAGELNMLRTNVEAVVHLCTALLPDMIHAGAGAILNVASTAAFQPIPGQAGYGASKAFVLSFTQAIRAEVTGSGVHVTALCPGPVETGFADAAGIDPEQARNTLPGIMWESAADVAAAGIQGLERNRMVVIPGAANRVSSLFGVLTPKSVLLPVMAKKHPML